MAEPKLESVFDVAPNAAEEARLDLLAEADIAAGRIVPHAKVVEWLDSWGTPAELPCPLAKAP